MHGAKGKTSNPFKIITTKKKKQSEGNFIKAIKDRIIRSIKNFFEQEEDHSKPVREGNSCSSNYVEYENNSDKNKTLSIKEYINETKPYLKDIINNLKKIVIWNISLTKVINFFKRQR